MIRNVMHILTRVICFFFVSVPSIIYGISPYPFIPVGWVVRLLIGKPAFSFAAGVIALKLSTIALLLIVPTVLYLYVWKPLGWIFFIWMGLYLLSRLYSGVHKNQLVIVEAGKQLDAFAEKFKNTHVKYNPIATVITLLLSVASLFVGNYLGGEMGIWIGLIFAIVIWCFSPFVRETIIEKTGMENNQD